MGKLTNKTVESIAKAAAPGKTNDGDGLYFQVSKSGGTSWIFVLLTLGGFITAIGPWWVQLRAAVMRALPDFPGKSRLPPYGSTE